MRYDKTGDEEPGICGFVMHFLRGRDSEAALAGTAFCMYYLAGFFGAAAFGENTEGNILENSLGSNTKAQGALNIFMTGKVACLTQASNPTNPPRVQSVLRAAIQQTVGVYASKKRLPEYARD